MTACQYTSATQRTDGVHLFQCSSIIHHVFSCYYAPLLLSLFFPRTNRLLPPCICRDEGPLLNFSLRQVLLTGADSALRRAPTASAFLTASTELILHCWHIVRDPSATDSCSCMVHMYNIIPRIRLRAAF